MSRRTFALMWDCHGLEAIACVSDIEQAILLETLKTGQQPRRIQAPNLMHWQLRAQFNPQRHYEIYLCSADDDVTEDDLWQFFESAPQQAADTVRRLGHCYYSNRADPARVKIV